MRKKYLYFLLLGLVVFSLNGSTDAAKKGAAGAGGQCTATLQMDALKSPGNGTYYSMSLNGEQAFCIDPGKKARRGETCTTGGAQNATADQLRIVNYAQGNNSVSNPSSQISYQQQQEIYIELSRGNYDKVDQLLKNNSNPGLASQIRSEFTSTSPAKLGSNAVILYCGGDMTGSTYQRMIVPSGTDGLGCTEEQPTHQACTDGQMHLSNSGASCYVTYGGIESYYSYTAGGGGNPMVHSQYGEAVESPGEYCHMFCQEYGTSVLPGALGVAVQAGSHIIWPTSESNQINKYTKDMYPMYVEGKKECKLLLMPDHGNYPSASTGNGGCNEDPVGDYACLYNASNMYEAKTPRTCNVASADSVLVLGNTGDFLDGTNYERVRVANGNYFNEPSYCGDQMQANGQVNKGEGCVFQKYKIINGGTSKYYNGIKYGVYNAKVQEINQNAERAATACKKVKDAEKVAKKTQEAYNAAGQAFQGVAGLDDRDPTKAAAKSKLDEAKAANDQAQAELNKARDEFNKAKKAYEDAIKWVETHIYKSIQRCQVYIRNFNTAREILDAIAQCGNFSVGDANAYYSFTADGNISFQNGEYSVGGNLYKDGGGVSCTGGCGPNAHFPTKGELPTLQSLLQPPTLKGMVNGMESREIVLTAAPVKYELADGYSYIDKKKNKYSRFPAGANYMDIPTLSGGLAKVLPTDYNSPVVDSSNTAVQYDLILNGVVFGENAKFKVNDGGNYVCKYTMTKESSECVCPQDTPGDGKNIMGHVLNEGISCAEAQAKYCDAPGTDSECGEACFCVFDNKVVDISACIKTGVGADTCKRLLCSGGPYKCKNTNGLRTGMDITGCVGTRMAEGESLQAALAYCDSVVCPIGKTIIYRTIRLENPFPGKNISKIVDGFNNEVKGRYPGYNWNSKTLVNRKIRNNRGVSGTTIYQTKTPLYSFELNGATIERIRNYNRNIKDGYNDFNLTCMKNKHAACISHFVRGRSSAGNIGLTGGTCAGAGNDSSFYSCLNN